MNDKKAFMVVGHENWGKSFTMNKIRNGKKHSLEIKGIEFWARNMSNDRDGPLFSESRIRWRFD